MTLADFLKSTDSQFVFVRGRTLAYRHRVKELRTKRNTYQAAAFDSLGNCQVLTVSGMCKQLIGDEIDW